jgi:two-component system, cell cycle sensor histidine kinase and response regulator CckA
MLSFLDIRTLAVATGFLSFSLAVFMTIAMRVKGRGPAFRLYALALFSLFVGEVLVSTQGYLHEILSVVLGNAGILGFFALSYHGLTVFMERKASGWHFLVLAAVIAVPFAFFTFIMPDVSARIVIFSLAALAYCAAFLGVLLGDVRRRLGPSWVLLCAVGCAIAVSLLWLGDALFFHSPDGVIMEGGMLGAVILMATIPMIVGMVLGLLNLASQKTEKERQESEAMSRSVFAHAPDAILISDAEGRNLDANPAACTLYGYTRAQLMGMNAADVWEAPPAAEVIAKGRFPSEGYLESNRRGRDGQDLVVELAYARIPYAGGAAVMGISRDVSLRRAAEQGLRESEQRYKALVATVSDIIWEVDLEGRFRSISPKVRDILGVEPETLIGRSIFEQMPHEQGVKARARMAEMARDRGAFTGFLSESRSADGRLMVFESSGVPTLGPDGAVRGFWICTRDVTERARAEEELRANEKKLRTIFESSGAGIVLMDSDGVITFANQRMADMLRCPLEEIIGSPYYSHVHPRDEDVSREVLNGMIAGTIDSLAAERRYLCADGSEFWGLVSSRRIVDSNDRFAAIVSSITDFTELRNAEEALRRSEEHHRNIFMNAPFGITRTTVADRQLAVNPSMARILGYGSPEEMQSMAEGRKISEAIYEDPRERARVVAAALGEPGWHSFEGIRMRRKDGTTAITNITVRALGSSGAATEELETFIEDITERKRAEAEHEKLQAQFQQAQKMEAVGRLAGGIAHDFNNLLTVILGYSDMAVAQTPAEDPGRMFLAGISDAARRAARLTTQLLAFSRKQILQPKLIDMDELIIGMADMLRRLLGEDIELRVLRPQGLWRVHADPGQIEQVVMNLAVNARDAMPGGGTLTIETANTRIDAAYAHGHVDARQGGYVLLTVSDSGIGMDGATLARIFEPFFTTKEVGKGTGLGLATVYGIVKQSGGHIACYSEPGRGTTFRVFLPRAGEGAAEGEEAGDEKAAAKGGTETLLLVEDDAMMRGFTGLLLKEAGYTVLVACDGSDAIRLLAERAARPALLITDVVMPGMDGKAVAEAVHVLHPGLPVLFLSGYTEDVIVNRGVLEPGVQFLAKPFTADTLLRKLRTLLDGR